MYRAWLVVLVLIVGVQAESSPFKFEGVWGSPVEDINNMNGNTQPFLPYNPVIVEIGAYEGRGTRFLAHAYPYGKVFAFEPHPEAYRLLTENVKSLKNVTTLNLAVGQINGIIPLWGSGAQASLVHLENTHTQISVPCVVLDDWCKQNGIEKIDFLRLDAGGFEGQILSNSLEILKTTTALVVKTHLYPSVKSIASYHVLKVFLTTQGFELLSHWYQEGKEGEATFIRKHIYDALFR